MGGGFGFGMLADVQMLGFYQAQHARTRKPYLAYVLQVSTAASAHFLIYRCDDSSSFMTNLATAATA